MPIIIAGMAIPAMRAMPTGAPTNVPSCQRIFFFLLQGFFPQKVQPEGLRKFKGQGGWSCQGKQSEGVCERVREGEECSA